MTATSRCQARRGRQCGPTTFTFKDDAAAADKTPTCKTLNPAAALIGNTDVLLGLQKPGSCVCAITVVRQPMRRRAAAATRDRRVMAIVVRRILQLM